MQVAELLSIISSFGVPASLVAGGLVMSSKVSALFGKVLQRLDNIEMMQAAILEKEAECRAQREHAEEVLHDRVTGVQDRVARLEGRCNGFMKKEDKDG